MHAARWSWLGQSIVDEGHELDVVVPRWRNQPRLPHDNPALRVHEVRSLVPGLGIRRRVANEALGTVQSLVQALSTPRPDVVVATVPALSTLPLGWLVSRLRRTPLVLELRDAWPHLLQDFPTWDDDGTQDSPTLPQRAPLWTRALTCLAWRMESAAATVVVTSDALRDDLLQRGFASVELARNIAQRPARQPHTQRTEGPLHVVYLGSFGRAQKLSTAVRAAALAQQRGVDVQLRLVGGGVHEAALRDLAARLDAPVEFVPRVRADEVDCHYEWADSVLVMLRDWDGMRLTVPSKLYEALHSGRHISASIDGEAARIVAQTGAGDVVPQDDPEALAQLWTELAAHRERLQVGVGGQEWLAGYADLASQATAAIKAFGDAARRSPVRGSGRVTALADDVRLTGDTILGHLGSDSATFYVQLARRTGLARRVPTGRGPAAVQVVAAHLSDQPALVDEAVARWAPEAGQRRSHRVLDRVAAAAAQARGLQPQVPQNLVQAEDRARERVAAGDLSGAIDGLPAGSAMAARLRSTRATMQPDFRLSAPAADLAQWRPRPQSVLHVLTNSLPHTRSGSTLRSQAIMQAQRDSGWRVEAATRIGYPVTIGRIGTARVEMVDGIPVHRIIPPSLPPLAQDRLAEHARRLSALVATVRPSVLHTTTDYTNGLVTQAVAEAWGIPWVYEMRGQLELTWLSKRPEAVRAEAASSEFLRLQRDRETACARAADAVVVLSQVQKDDLAARGVDAGKILVVPNAVDQELLLRDGSPRQARARLGLDADARWVGAMSSLVEYEGFETLLRAVAELRGQGRDVRCALVGDGTSRPSLMALARELGIYDACEFPGRVGRAAALTWVEALDVVCIPRQDTPVCRVVTPLKPVEAMALGRPVVASDLPALRELVEPSGAPLVAPGDPGQLAQGIASLLDTPDLYADCATRGRAWAAERTWQAAADGYDRLYRSLEALR